MSDDLDADLSPDAVRARQALKAPHPRCWSCNVRLNRWTVHKPTCEAKR